MFHLEDYMDKLVVLPLMVKKRLDGIGNLDVQVEQTMNTVNENVDDLFSKAPLLKPEELEHNFNAIMKKGEKAIELSENKIQEAISARELLEKYMEKLNSELQNFQMALDEQYGSAIAEEIEKRVSNSDEGHMTIPKQNNYQYNNYVFGDEQSDQSSSGLLLLFDETNFASPSPEYFKMNSPLQEFKKSSLNVPQQEINYGQISSLLPSNVSIDNEIVVKSDEVQKSEKKNINNEKKSSDGALTIEKNTVEPDPRRYCICNDVAYDRMIACDNKSCPYEWFHFECVGILNRPRRKWYCTLCAKKLKKRSR